jgi:hypothetical protein
MTRRHLVGLFLMLPVGACASAPPSRDVAEHYRSTPDGPPLTLSSFDAVPPPSEEDLYCANQGGPDWRVALRDDVVEVRRSHDSLQRDAVPFALPKETWPQLLFEYRARQGCGGWLVGYNSGEFGGGLWSFSPDGKRFVKVAGGQVVGIHPTPEDAFLVVTGIAHMGMDRGGVLKVQQQADGVCRVVARVDLGSAVEASVAHGNDVVAALYDGRVIRVHVDMTVEELVEKPTAGSHYTLSGVIIDGHALFSKRFYLQRVPLAADAGEATWLAPSQCKGASRCKCFPE